ncbi:hypothetical protein HK405_015722, partial [Cladochytrium tenue]
MAEALLRMALRLTSGCQSKAEAEICRVVDALELPGWYLWPRPRRTCGGVVGAARRVPGAQHARRQVADFPAAADRSFVTVARALL